MMAASFSLDAALGGGDRAPGECVIRVDGAEISTLYPFLVQVTANCGRMPADTAQLVFASLRDDRGSWSVQDAGILAPWKSIVIEAAFGRRSEEVFRGVIRSVNADYPTDAGSATVTVECQDDSLRLDRTQQRKAWGAEAPVSDQTILAQLVANHSLTPHPDNGNGAADLVLNQDATDIAFLRERAEANGYELMFREGQVYFGPMRLSGMPQATILVYAGPATNCLSFKVVADGHQPDQVAFDVAPVTGTEVVSRSLSSDLPLLGTSPATDDGSLGDFTWRLTRPGTGDAEQLTALAQRQVNEAAMRVRAEGELDGTLYGHVLKPGATVGVDGVGDWLGGIYYVDQVNHRFDTHGYQQQFKLMRNAYGDNLSSAGADPLGGLF
jgi:phage protein D